MYYKIFIELNFNTINDLNFQVHYDYYNKKFGHDGIHETLDWHECDEEIKEFEKNMIMKHVFETEEQEKWYGFKKSN